jgi:hypothetical protein
VHSAPELSSLHLRGVFLDLGDSAVDLLFDDLHCFGYAFCGELRGVLEVLQHASSLLSMATGTAKGTDGTVV